MDTTNNKGAPSQGTPSKTPHDDSNSAEVQRRRLLAALRIQMVSTIVARRELDIMMPAARIHELRHRFGYQIDKVWVKQPTDCGKLHRVALYVLISGKVCHE